MSRSIVHCDGPQCEHAFDTVPVRPRPDHAASVCPVCEGHGEWNSEIDLVTFRCVRTECDRCLGSGWVVDGDGRVPIPDIVRGPGGEPHWIERCVRQDWSSDR